MNKKSTRDPMLMMDLNEEIDQLARASIVRWHGHVLIKDKKSCVRRALDFKVIVTRKRCRPKKTWLMTVVEQSRKVGLNDSDDNNRSI